MLAVACENVPQIALQLIYLLGTTPTHHTLPTLSIVLSTLALAWRLFKKMLGYVAGDDAAMTVGNIGDVLTVVTVVTVVTVMKMCSATSLAPRGVSRSLWSV